MTTPANPLTGQPTPQAPDLSKFSFDPETNTIHAPTGEVYSTGAPIDVSGKAKPRVFTADDFEPVSQDTGLVDTVKSYWRRANDVLNTSPFQKVLGPLSDAEQSVIDTEVNSGNPHRAAMAQGFLGAAKDINSLLMNVTTPKNVAFMALTGGDSTAVKALATATNLYFAYRGGESILQGRQPNETTPDYVQRVLEGGSQAALATAGAGATAKDFLHDAIRNNLGLSGDLAGKVQAKMEAIEQIRAETNSEAASTSDIAKGIDKQFVNDTQSGGIVQQSMGKLLAQAQQAITTEQARVTQPFIDMEAKTADMPPVTSGPDMRAEITNTLKAEGVQDTEISKVAGKIFAAIPNEPGAVVATRQPTSMESTMAVAAKDWQKQGMSRADIRSEVANKGLLGHQVDMVMDLLDSSNLTPAAKVAKNFAAQGMLSPDIRAAMVNQGFAPKEIDDAIAPKSSAAQTSVDFPATRRIAEDLYQAAQSSNDADMRRGLGQAYKVVQNMRQTYAEDQGFGKQFQDANRDYFQFKHDLGSGPMNEFMAAKDFHDQGMLAPASTLLNENSGEMYRKLFHSMGIDTSELEDFVNDRAETAAAARQRVKDIQAGGAQRVQEKGLENSIIPGQSDEQLAGKDTLQIQRDAIKAMVNKARAGGIANPMAMTQILYGTAMLSMGSMFGFLHLGRAGAPEGIKLLLKNPSFQDWVMQDGGVEQPQIPLARKAIGNMYPALRKLAESTIPARVLDQTRQSGQ